MPNETLGEHELDQLRKATLRFNARILGVVLGLIFGLMTFLATNWLIIKGGHVNEAGEVVIGPHLALLSQYFIGYRVSFIGSIVGFIYSFVLGMLTGWLISRIYNWVARVGK
jgi:hypothetical protein